MTKQIKGVFGKLPQFYIFQVQFQEGRESPATAELYKVLKDHKNPFMQDLVRSSYKHCYEGEARKVVGDDGLCTQELDDCGTENVVRVTLVNQKFHASLLRAVERLTTAKLQLDKFGFESSTTTSQASTSQLATANDEDKMLSNKLAILVNDIAIAMGKLSYGTYRGKIYKKDASSMFTFSYKCEARAFVNALATNEQFKSRMLPQMKKIIELLSDPYCELFRPLTVDYDLIEVKNGACWSLKTRSFVEDAIAEHQIGKVTPRAFCPYEPNQVPDAKYFRQILENSLSQDDVCRFCEEYLKLLNYNKKKHKDKVLCLVGDANSGKTSLFFPILSIVHHGNVATVTKQRAFNKSMITPFTEVIFLDEATESTLDIDDWKTLTQGGYSAHDVKYQRAKSFINRCPMLITSQRRLNFGPADQPAMDRRLSTYQFKSLANPTKRASSWLKKHPMECLIWATEKAQEARHRESEEEDESETDEERALYEDGTLQQSEKEALQALSLDEAPIEESAPAAAEGEDFEVSAGQSDASPGDDIVYALEERIRRLQPESLRHRQATHMLQAERTKRVRAEEFRKEQHKRLKSQLKDRGVSTQHLELVPSDPEQPWPSQVASDLERHERRQMEAREQSRREAARKAFEGAWLLATERELKECCDEYRASDDPSIRANLKAFMRVLSDKLKDHHLVLGTYGTAEALDERKRVCTALGLLSKEKQHLVTSVSERLPVMTEAPQQPSDEVECGQEGPAGHAEEVVEDDGEEEQNLFITPAPSREMSHTAFERTRKEATSSRKRARSQRTRSKRAKTQSDNAITRYFSSQQ